MDVTNAHMFTIESPGRLQLRTPTDGGFDDALARADHDARKAAEQFVATAFIMPMLAALRDDPFKSELFHGGAGEDAFGQQLDTVLADQIVQRMSQPTADLDGRTNSPGGFGLVESIHRRVMQRAEGVHKAAQQLGRSPSPAQADRIDIRG